MKKLVIFDMDGVLLDSEQLCMDMNQQFFKQLGAHISREEHQTFIGISATRMWSTIKERFNLTETVEMLNEQEKLPKYKTLDTTDLSPNEGVLDLLMHLKQTQHTLAIASSSLRMNIDLILSKLNIHTYFELIVSGEQVLKGKPDPDIFLKVAAHYKYSPSDCVVIENSTNGVTAAKAAGMICVGYRNLGSGNQDLSKADLIIDHFGDKGFRALFN